MELVESCAFSILMDFDFITSV